MTRVGWIAAGVEARLSVAGHAKRHAATEERYTLRGLGNRGLSPMSHHVLAVKGDIGIAGI